MENLPPEAWRMPWEDGAVRAVGDFLLRRKTERWVKHYSSSHQILLVGEGDFSFSLSLALAFGSASNILATSLDSYDALLKNYKRARSNLEQLIARGATILHEVNAKEMKNHIQLRSCKFDRIVFNFPHAGFYGKEDNPELIKMHKDLVRRFFCNARWLLQNNGEIHISHKNSAPYCHWNLEELALENSLLLIESVPFDISEYPYYQNKRGHGSDSDEPFFLGDCSTFKFIASHPSGCLGTPVIFNTNLVKFIVKGSVRAVYPRATGYVGVLMSQKNSIIAVISGPLQEVDSDVAELLAVREALLVFERSKLCGRVGLVVESDSRNTVSWIKSDIGNPWELQPVINEIKMAIKRIGNVDVQCSYPEFRVGTRLHRLGVLDELGVDRKSSLELWL